MTLADEYTNSILTDNAKRAFQGNVAMQVTQPGGQLWNQAMQVTSSDDQCGKASDSIWWENVQLMQVVPCGGQICN